MRKNFHCACCIVTWSNCFVAAWANWIDVYIQLPIQASKTALVRFFEISYVRIIFWVDYTLDDMPKTSININKYEGKASKSTRVTL